MKKIILTPKIKMRMLLILLFGAIIVAGIFAYGFFQMQKESFNQTKQFKNSLDQYSQMIKVKNDTNCNNIN
jgi:flagellar basal body-associated protein FliL